VFVVLATIAVLAGAAALLVTSLGRHRRFNEVDRFHNAGRLTSEWARSGVTKPLIAEQPGAEEKRARTDA
jgi:hypothetical protein